MHIPDRTAAAPQCTAQEQAQAAYCELQVDLGGGGAACMQVQGSAAQHEDRQGRAGAGQRSMRAGAEQGSMMASARQQSVSAAAGQCRLRTGAGRRCQLTGDCQHPCGRILALQCRMVTTSVCRELAGHMHSTPCNWRPSLPLSSTCTLARPAGCPSGF